MNKFILSILLFLFSCFSVHGKIREVSDLSEFEQAVYQLKENSLVIFDVDDTLIIPGDRILRTGNAAVMNRLVREILNNHALVPIDKYPEDYLHSQVLLGWGGILIDQKVLTLIKYMQEKHIKVIALTNVGTGPFGTIQSQEDLRFEELTQVGIDFSQAFPHHPYLVFPALAVVESSPPVFKQGILFSAYVPKGEVLRAFLKHMKWKPTHILFVDDRKKQIDSVEAVMQEEGIEVTSFYYQAVKHMPRELDEKLGEFQFKYLAEHGVWLNDEKAKKLLDQAEKMPCER
jgi:FMN phosphatase YigB (HAD superfamily)